MLSDWIDRLAVWEGFHPDLQTLVIYGVGIALYTTLVFTFYSNVARRDPLHSAMRPGWWGKVVHATETMLTFPILSFGYFAVLSIALMVMAKETTPTAFILLLSMAAVLGVRATAHVSESMANDLAKVLPLGLLGVVLVEPGYLRIETTFARIGESVGMAPVLFQYFVLFIVAEALMRALRAATPGVGNLWQRHERHKTLSKKAMLRDVAHEHGGHRSFFHEHSPRTTKTQAYVELDEGHVGKPGRNQGAGPALGAQKKAPHVSHAPSHAGHKPGARAGPGGSGGKLGSW